MPDWLLKLGRRLMALEPGRYVIILTVGKAPNWRVQRLGEVEK